MKAQRRDGQGANSCTETPITRVSEQVTRSTPLAPLSTKASPCPVLRPLVWMDRHIPDRAPNTPGSPVQAGKAHHSQADRAGQSPTAQLCSSASHAGAGRRFQPDGHRRAPDFEQDQSPPGSRHEASGWLGVGQTRTGTRRHWGQESVEIQTEGRHAMATMPARSSRAVHRSNHAKDCQHATPRPPVNLPAGLLLSAAWHPSGGTFTRWRVGGARLPGFGQRPRPRACSQAATTPLGGPATA